MKRYSFLAAVLYGVWSLFCQIGYAEDARNTSLASEQAPIETQSETMALQKRPHLTVSVVSPIYRKISKKIEATGTIESKEIAAVTAQIAGLNLAKIRVDVGDSVQKGQIVAEYDARSVNNDIEQAKAALMQARLSLKQATINAERAKKLRRSKAISALESDNFLFQAQQASAKVDAAKAVLNNQQLRAHYAVVTSPVNGTVLEKQAVLGAVGNLGTPLFTLLVDHELEWHAKVPSEMLRFIFSGMPVTVKLHAVMSDSSLSKNVEVAGTVRIIDPTVDAKTRLGTVYVTMNNHSQLRRGLFVRGAFDAGVEDHLLIPVTAVTRKDGYSYAFVVDSNSIVTRVKIITGELHGNTIVVLRGLSAKDRVVRSGVGFLNSGDLVRVIE